MTIFKHIFVIFQSFGLPSLKVKPEHAGNITVQEGPFGIPSPMVAGLAATKNKLGMSHPLQASEQNVCISIFHSILFISTDLYIH